jgi:hypothetical protein
MEEPAQALVPDQLVEMLVPDPSQPPTPTVALAGLLGRSAKEGYWRLYFSSSLKRYVEFKEEDVLHSVKIPKEQPPFAGLEATRVWLKREAEVEYTRTESRRLQAEVLQSGMAARMPIDPPPELAVLRSPIDPPPDLAVLRFLGTYPQYPAEMAIYTRPHGSTEFRTGGYPVDPEETP